MSEEVEKSKTKRLDSVEREMGVGEEVQAVRRKMKDER
jgi:hypothetical protein